MNFLQNLKRHLRYFVIKKFNKNSVVLLDIPGVKPRTKNIKDINIKKNELIHFQHLPDILFHENFDESLIKSLKKERKLIKRKLGELHSILLKEDSVEAFSDERRPDGKASSVYE